MSERVQAGRVASILGVSERMVRRLAQQRVFPDATKVGSVWTFDEQSVRDWLRRKIQREAEQCRPISISGRASGTHGSMSVAGMRDEAYERLIGLRPSGG